MVFKLRSAAYGGKPSNDVVRETGFSGRDMDALLTSIYQGPEPFILTQKNASRHVPEAGAVCVSSARTDLCGGAAGNCRPYRDLTYLRRAYSTYAGVVSGSSACTDLLGGGER